LRVVEHILDNDLDREFEAIEIGNDGAQVLTYFHEDVEKLLIVDSVLMSVKPGEYRVFKPDDVDSVKLVGGISTHEGDILKLIEMGKRLECHIPDITILGIQPASMDMEMSLSSELQANLETYVNTAIEQIKG